MPVGAYHPDPPGRADGNVAYGVCRLVSTEADDPLLTGKHIDIPVPLSAKLIGALKQVFDCRAPLLDHERTFQRKRKRPNPAGSSLFSVQVSCSSGLSCGRFQTEGFYPLIARGGRFPVVAWVSQPKTGAHVP